MMTRQEESDLEVACIRIDQVRGVAAVLAKYSDEIDVASALHCIEYSLSDIVADINAIIDGSKPAAGA